MKINLYRIHQNAVGGTKFPWASGYGLMEDMRFLDCLGEEWAQDIKDFLAFNNYTTPGMHIEGNGRTWSDFIGCGASGPGFFVSARVLGDIIAEGIDVMRAIEMPIAHIKTKRIQNLTPPKYYVLEAERGIEVDFAASGYPVAADGKPTSNKRNPAAKGPLALRRTTWTGKDLVSATTGATFCLYCTDRVKRLAEEKGWTNVKFTEVPVV